MNEDLHTDAIKYELTIYKFLALSTILLCLT